jgi:hypothetical protein
MDTSIAILTGAGLATLGWIYTARRSRTLSRKQHTVNVMLHTSLNATFLDAKSKLVPHLRAMSVPDDVITGKDEELRYHFRLVLNHYEFVAAGIRDGDMDEQLVRDSERSTVLLLFKACEKYIWAMRDERSRMTMYEHLEWIHTRWDNKPPKRFQRCVEWTIQRPYAGKRHDPHV